MDKGGGVGCQSSRAKGKHQDVPRRKNSASRLYTVTSSDLRVAFQVSDRPAPQSHEPIQFLKINPRTSLPSIEKSVCPTDSVSGKNPDGYRAIPISNGRWPAPQSLTLMGSTVCHEVSTKGRDAWSPGCAPSTQSAGPGPGRGRARGRALESLLARGLASPSSLGAFPRRRGTGRESGAVAGPRGVSAQRRRSRPRRADGSKS